MITQPRRLAAYGLSCEVPTGWHVRIEQRQQSNMHVPASDLPVGGYVHPILQAATSPLPAIRGDYGSGYVETMRPTDVFVCLGEFDHEAGETAMFDDGMARSLDTALRMGLDERKSRHEKLLANVQQRTAETWAEEFLNVLSHSR